MRPFTDAQQLKDQIALTQERLQQVNKTYTKYYNQHQTNIMFKEGDFVLINEKNIFVDK